MDAVGGSWGFATPHVAATEAGAAVLAGGGSAVDAALAAAAVLAVCYPHNCGVGGDLCALFVPADGAPTAVLGIGAAGSLTDPERVAARHGGVMPESGPDAVTVPGVVSGWRALHRLGGTRSFAELLTPAIDAARDGVPVARSVAAALGARAELVLADPGMRAVFAPGGALLGVGARLENPALARTLEEIAHDEAAPYRGPLAKRLATGMAALGCAVTGADLAAHRARLEAPIARDLPGLGVRVASCPPPSYGVAFLQIAAALDRLAGTELLGRDAHILAGLFAAVLGGGVEIGDGAPGPDEVARLLSPEVAGQLAARARDGYVRPLGGPAPRARGDTIALVAHDGRGDSVVVVQSLFEYFGAVLLDPGTGVILHNRGSGFSLASTSANRLGPRRRPAHTLTPVCVGSLGTGTGPLGGPLGHRALLGTMGGRFQPQILAQVLLQLAGGATPAEAVRAPRFVWDGGDRSAPGGVIRYEDDLPASAAHALGRLGVGLERLGVRSEDVGHAHALVAGGALAAGADPRSDGAARTSP